MGANCSTKTLSQLAKHAQFTSDSLISSLALIVCLSFYCEMAKLGLNDLKVSFQRLNSLILCTNVLYSGAHMP